MRRLIITGVVILSLGCSKNPGNGDIISRRDLLTGKPWVLNAVGFDDNKNNLVDAAEDIAEECHKDNTWLYQVDGTGLFEENGLSCGTGVDKQPFTWKFIQDETAIEFFYDTQRILRLTSTELTTYKVLTYANGETINILTTFKH